MRFFTFVKQHPTTSPDKLAFKQWIANSKMADKHHAGVVQVQLFVHLNNAPDNVVQGFNQYQEEYLKANTGN